eukprot:CAMPEP_0205805654 /NCGR_PEP_ID=MMETSP0205-20121125/8959_1 /ASSEMBLY_ACC=CAM_ASM_000278 /TAXON_ID=36767 /ORGANISM="Euplotes focardii, Strain TN1" /LENGTH=145 /DNA_ID=CAMNT_0053077251 /DNA_START=639 /DNA_END=1073 /DNA_ORIENTATION=-
MQKKNMNIHKNHTVSKQFPKNEEERSMSPMVNSQKMPNEFYDNYSRITSYDTHSNQLKQGNTGNMNLINTLNKSTISAKQSKKIFHSLGTLGLQVPTTNIISEYENIEEMHGVWVAFYQVTHTMLGKVENKNRDDKIKVKEGADL